LFKEKIIKINDLYNHLNQSKKILHNLIIICIEPKKNKIEYDNEIKNLYKNLYLLDNNYFFDMSKIKKEKKRI